MKNSQDVLDFFKGQIGKQKRFSTKADMARFLGLSDSDRAKLYKFLKGIDTQYRAIIDWFIFLGGKIIEQDSAWSREVHFIDVKSPLPDGELPVAPENYRAVPLISDAGAGPGIIRNEYEEPREWFLVNRGAQSMLGRPVDKLYAVRIDARSTSMEPTLHPGDTVLIDPTDIRVDKPGGIFLVIEPGPDGAAKIKRVNIERVQSLKVTRLTFYSDNVQEYPPEVHILEHDYENELSRAIAGRVIWAWTDLSKK